VSTPLSPAGPPRRRRLRRILFVLLVLAACAAGAAVAVFAAERQARASAVETTSAPSTLAPPDSVPFTQVAPTAAAPRPGRGRAAATLDARHASSRKLPGVRVRAGILIDARSGRVLWMRRAHLGLPIASLTKMMTALVAVRPVELQRVIRVRASWLGIGESTIDLKAGQKIRMGTLLRGLLMVSGNDAANVLADVRAGSLRAFVGRMNARARAMRLRSTHFSNPSGLVDRGNRSSAWDLAKIGRQLLREPVLAAIVRRRAAPAPRNVTWVNHNKLLWELPGAIGLKTGYTDLAGSCLASAARRNGRTLIAIVLHASGDEFAASAKLLRWGFRR
jgi:D-alanyl-D-alanine carboxypeptidase (penicillin-binding protein 5/6)